MTVRYTELKIAFCWIHCFTSLSLYLCLERKCSKVIKLAGQFYSWLQCIWKVKGLLFYFFPQRKQKVRQFFKEHSSAHTWMQHCWEWREFSLTFLFLFKICQHRKWYQLWRCFLFFPWKDCWLLCLQWNHKLISYQSPHIHQTAMTFGHWIDFGHCFGFELSIWEERLSVW